MELQYVDEERKRVNELMLRLDSMPVGKSGTAAGGHGGPVQHLLQQRFARRFVPKLIGSAGVAGLGPGGKGSLAHATTGQPRSGPLLRSTNGPASRASLAGLTGDLETAEYLAMHGTYPLNLGLVSEHATPGSAFSLTSTAAGFVSGLSAGAGTLHRIAIQLNFTVGVRRIKI
ncbi:unnamed protein product [Protopolystoma xenopodis]|uniref:Uncharacterized protein n=1 Tax=Protopolystoma xenopodis TaxID=117903 RepID=A0A3S5B694_9PLAT|nr:unnamed protein product [Protopolystoma xenopodis]